MNDEEVVMPSLTYNVENGRIAGKIDGQDAMIQAIDKALMTERFVFEIYGDQYGNDMNDMIGKDIPFIEIALEQVLQEALLTDDRVYSVNVNGVEQKSGNTFVFDITVQTVFGNVRSVKEVQI